jgi:hypothetical protein
MPQRATLESPSAVVLGETASVPEQKNPAVRRRRCGGDGGASRMIVATALFRAAVAGQGLANWERA